MAVSFEQGLKLQRMLQAGPVSYDEMGAATKLSRAQVTRWVKHSRESIHIRSYGPDINGRLFVAKFAWGVAPDAERPGQSVTPAQRMRAMRQRRAMSAL